jgi:hypothetical protein
MNILLAQEVKKRVLAEPKAVNMNFFCEIMKDPKKNLCNTVGCIAGHAIMASGISLKTIKTLELDNLDEIGRGLLRISKAKAKQLFYFFADDKAVESGDELEKDCPYVQFARRLRKQRPGSERYAKIVADAIDHCMYRHANELQLMDE